MTSRLLQTFSKSLKNSDYCSRQFGALTQKSWSNYLSSVGNIPSDSTCRKPSSQTDVLLDGLFSRQVPLPYIQEQVSLQSVQLNLLDQTTNLESIQTMNRNARRPNKANRGARPCSRTSRRKKKDAIGKRRR